MVVVAVLYLEDAAVLPVEVEVEDAGVEDVAGL